MLFAAMVGASEVETGDGSGAGELAGTLCDGSTAISPDISICSMAVRHTEKYVPLVQAKVPSRV